jgi:hypothetical protein
MKKLIDVLETVQAKSNEIIIMEYINQIANKARVKINKVKPMKVLLTKLYMRNEESGSRVKNIYKFVCF